MKNSTFSAQVANNLLTLLQGYTKGIRFIALLTMLCTIGVGNAWGQTTVYTETFEDASYKTSTTYNNSTEKKHGPTNYQWGVLCGTPNTGAHNGSKAFAMRYYKSVAKTPTLTQYFDINSVDRITFWAKTESTTNKLNVEYSTNGGSSWSSLASNISVTTSYKEYTYDFPTQQSAVRLRFTMGTTTEKKSMFIDDIAFIKVSSGSEPETPVPSLTATPTTIDFGTVEQGATIESKSVSVNFANLTDAVTYSGLSTPFSADGSVSNDGDKITIAANTATIGEYSQTLTIASSADDKSVKVVVKMNVVAPFEGKKLVFDFVTHPSGWPAKANSAEGNYVYTLDEVDYTFTHTKSGDGIYLGGTTITSGYLMIPTGNKLGLPAIKGYKLVKVDGTLNGSGTPSTASQVSITNAGGTVISGGAAQTWDTQGGTKTYNLTDTEANTVYYLTVANKNLQMITLALYYEEVAGAVEIPDAPTLTASQEFETETFTVEISAVDGATIHYTLDGTDPTKASTTYSAPFTVNATTTVKAIAVKSGVASNVATATYTKVSIIEKTCAEAAALCTSTESTDKYRVEGYVTAIETAYSAQYNNITVWMADTRNGGNVLQAYRTTPTVEADKAVKVGDQIEVVGKLKLYNSTPEIVSSTYTITQLDPVYAVNITSAHGTVTATPASAVEGTEITLSVEVESGWVFQSWTVTDASSNPIEVTDNKFTMPASDVTVVANYTESVAPDAVLTLMANGNQHSQETYKVGETVKLPATIDNDCVKQFVGWSTNANCATEPEYAPGANFKLTANTHTLYAVYASGGSGETVTITPSAVDNDAENDIHTFTIDATGYSLTAKKNNGSTVPTFNESAKDVRIYAKGTLTISAPNVMNTIVFNISTQGKKRLAPITASVGAIATQASGDATVTWTGDATEVTFTVGDNANYGSESDKAGQLCFSTISLTSGGAFTDYSTTCESATPDPATYTITYVTNGGSKIDPMTEQTALPNPLPETERDHYTFAGWFTDEGCTQAATAGATIYANTTLYANWTPITYTVTFDAGYGTCDTELTQGNFETGITLPTATPCTYAQENGWSFVGWSESTVSETTVRPTIYAAESNYKPTNNRTLHAVYAKTEAGQGGANEFILSLVYEDTPYYVGQTYDSGKLSAETDQNNAARFTIEDNYLHYEGGYISHVAEGTNLTKQTDKAKAQTWTIAENGNNITFTSTADDTRGLGFNFNKGGTPRFAAYQLSNADYPHTFTKTSVSGGNIQVTTYNSNPACEAPIDPNWVDATISHAAIQVACGSKTQLGAAAPNGPATITFNGYDLQNSVTVTASEGFLVSTNKEEENTYKQEVTVNPHKDGQNIGKIQNVYVIANATAKNESYTGTITLTGADITNGPQVINVTAAVTCTQYTITWSVSGDETQKTTFYAGGDWELPENPTFDCNGRVFVGWTNTEILQPQDIAPNVLYKEQGDFPTIESDRTFYAVFAQEGTGDGSGTATVTDVLNREWTDVSGTTYKDWNGKTATSSAVYAGNSAGGNESIQLRSDASKDAAGIITTTSGGKATKVIVAWHNETADDRTLNVYGKNSAYSAVADLRGENTRGTLLGTIVNGTSTSLTINDDYEYIGLCSKSGAMYLTSISITWATDGEGDGNATTYTSYTTSCADVKAIRIVEPTTKTFNEGDKFVFDGEVWAINSDDTETNVTNSSLVRFTHDMNKVGTQTVTVSYLGFTATYEITINAVEKWQITWNVSGATNTGLGPKEVAKGTAIGKLPNPKIPDGCEGKTCVGWTESNTVNSDGTEITFITSSTVPTQNTTYYAVFATQSGNAGDGDYVKLTETPADLSGEYLIVYEDSEGSPAAPKAFNGGLGTLDAASNTISVTISNNTIESTDVTDAAKFTITKNGDAYIITSASNFHIGQTSDANGLQSSTLTSYTNTITITEDSANIIGEGGAYLRYNKTSSINNGKETGLRFRYYKSTSYTYQQPIALYKKSGSSASYTDYTTGCHNVTITYYGFTGGYTTNCGGSDLNVITQRVNSSHTIPTCTEISDPTTLGRTFLNLWKDQNGKEHKPGESFIVTENITLYAQWALNTSENTTLPTDVEDLATTDIVVTGGTTLTLQAGTTTINSLTLKGGLQENGTYAMPVVNIPNGATLVRNNNKINLDLKVNNNSYYPFAVPFEVANTSDNVNYINPTLKAYANAINGYGTYYRILEYNGALRAENGVNSAENWVQVGRTGVKLMPGKGYAISAVPASGQDTVTIRITMTVDNAWLADGEQESIIVKEQTTTRNQVTVTAYTGDAATEHQRHAGWNFVANPYLANFAGTNASGSFINGEILIDKGEYSYSDDKVPYVTIPTYDFAHYNQVRLSEATLSPAYSFFVQVGKSGTMTFDVAGRQAAPASIAARNAEERPVKMDVDITLSDNHSSDQTGIIISDRYSEAYEIGRDLEKLFGSAYNLSVYTLMADNTPLAFQALAIRSNMQVIPVGYRTPAQGEYTFRLNEATSSIDLLNEQYEQLVLVDYQTGELTNLLIADYTFYSERTQADNRFAIYAVPRQNAPTDLPNAIGQDKQAQKIIHNGHLYILRDGNVYNGNGQIVK